MFKTPIGYPKCFFPIIHSLDTYILQLLCVQHRAKDGEKNATLDLRSFLELDFLVGFL